MATTRLFTTMTAPTLRRAHVDRFATAWAISMNIECLLILATSFSPSSCYYIFDFLAVEFLLRFSFLEFLFILYFLHLLSVLFAVTSREVVCRAQVHRELHASPSVEFLIGQFLRGPCLHLARQMPIIAAFDQFGDEWPVGSD